MSFVYYVSRYSIFGWLVGNTLAYYIVPWFEITLLACEWWPSGGISRPRCAGDMISCYGPMTSFLPTSPPSGLIRSIFRLSGRNNILCSRPTFAFPTLYYITDVIALSMFLSRRPCYIVPWFSLYVPLLIGCGLPVDEALYVHWLSHVIGRFLSSESYFWPPTVNILYYIVVLRPLTRPHHMRCEPACSFVSSSFVFVQVRTWPRDGICYSFCRPTPTLPALSRTN